MLRRWGRRSEKHLFGTTGGGRVFREDLDGIPYDNDYIFDVLPWNFEPSELGAAFGLEQLKKLDRFTQIRRHNFDYLTEFFGRHVDRFVLAAPGRRPRDRLAVLPRAGAARRRIPPQRPPGIPRQCPHRQPHGVDGQRHPPADDAAA